MGQEKYAEVVSALTSLGFTELESAVYSYLVENSPATPYRVAQEIGKPVANTYKAVDSLFQKGLVLIDETENRQCQAVPPDELLQDLQRTFSERHRNAAETLAKLRPTRSAERVFSIPTAEQVFERVERLVAVAESIILVDAYPGVIETIRPWLEAAAGRGVEVVLEAYEPVDLKGVEVIQFRQPERMLRRWRGDWLIIVVDGAEYLFAFLSDDGASVRNAIWSSSAFLSLPQHSTMAFSFRALRLEEMIRNHASHEELILELQRTEAWTTMGERGYARLASQFSGEKDRP